MRPISMAAVTAVCLFVFPVSAQVASQIVKPGMFIATTLNPTAPVSATSTVQMIDPFSRKSQAITFTGFTGQGEGPDSILIETPISIVFGTRDPVLTQDGNIYRAMFLGTTTAWKATKLNTNASGVMSVAALVRLGSTIYYVGHPGASGTGGSSALLMSMPAAGGKVTLELDIGKLPGANGLGNALVAVGSVLHYFTFDSTTTAAIFAQHWTIDTSKRKPWTAVKLKDLPKSKRVVGTTIYNYGAVQADYDPRTGFLVIGGIYGDVLWRKPDGTDVRHVWTGLGTAANRLDGMAVNTDTDTVGLGDRAGNYEDLRCDGTRFKPNHIVLPAPITRAIRVSNMAYWSGKAKYLPIGAGCPMGTANGGLIPCNYVTSLPAKGAASFAVTVEGQTKLALLVIGLKTAKFDLTNNGAPGCFLYPTLDIILPGTITAQGAQVGPFQLPTSLPDITAYMQWFLGDSVNPFGLVGSDARRIDLR